MDDASAGIYRDGESLIRKITIPKHREHDVVMVWDGDSVHPTLIRCEQCDWTGVIHEAA